jgi:RNA 2',3'-cyclic 3'-phosphodiesterase
MPRLFIAIDLPDKTKEQLCRLRADIPGARWVPTDQLHLTLAFLGDVEMEKMNRLMGKLIDIHIPAFDLRIGDFGCFPNRKRPRVAWIGIRPEPLLMSLAEQVRKVLLLSEIPLEERPFSPHITLARIKQPVGGDCNAFLARTLKQEPALISVREFILFESRLSSRGALHIPLRSFQFSTPEGTLMDA